MYLPLSDMVDLTDISNAFSRNTTVKEVSLFSDFLDGIDENWMITLRRFFGQIGQIPSLEVMKFDYIGSTGDELPISLLSTVVQPASKLRRLELSCCQLTGTPDDFRAFSRILREHQQLRQLEVYGTYMCDAELISWPNQLDVIVTELAEIENLEDIHITALDFNSLGKLSHTTLTSLLNGCPKLKRLVLGEFEFNDEHIIAMATSLEKNRNLKELSFGCRLGTLGTGALVKMLPLNTSLEILHIHVSTLDGGEDHHVALACALKGNTTLTQFSLYGTTGKMTHKAHQAYADMLKLNYNLQELEFQDEDEALQPLMEMYLKLNRHGRGKLMQTGKSRDYILTILSLRDNLDCIFHLLSLYPALLASGPSIDGVEFERVEWSNNIRGIKRKNSAIEKLERQIV